MRATVLSLFCVSVAIAAEPVSLFDGQSLDGWTCHTDGVFRVENGAIVAGSEDEAAARNEFLCTTQEFEDFDLTLKFRVAPGPKSNAGVQFRTKRLPGNHEVSGYQADIGPGWFGALYDESRRNRILAKPDDATTKWALENVGEDGWHTYRIRAVGPQITLWLNGVQTVDYTEEDADIPQSGIIALQIHGGMTGLVEYKDVAIKTLD